MKKLFILSLTTLFLTACGHSIHVYHAGDYDLAENNKGREITASAEQFTVMGFIQETDYVNTAFDNLKKQCGGSISGINTRYSTSLGFFSWTNKIVLNARCIN